jgi:hypothetical protein
MIWIHNSRVGDNIMAFTPDFEKSILLRIGNPKAAVFPVPVCANAIKSSLEELRIGIESSCILVGFVKPSSLTAVNSSGLSPKDSNVIVF